ncbi:hypothetical protein [Solitalea canadensis]|uniref:Uncharacterized protein n=1 Tax=Solitalea canadensis (strain ATCC 29591 / DSM 3403 / JCM 21819 / LMG 8368 / NBRC 15130 / NCIMB 12057 / USAM 9D) TaxID=929556 RepID=H8KU90_SOLCM|nr:hypothetical protein [Solitalea canadensis]AFD07202.1 hypothetical protein Solca_2149 [Solitalea canadensis DSM 3403]
MEEKTTISKNRKLPQAMDYELLRKEGLRHIESLSSDLWTDYNVHDPGITILEALCYAITELGYRCQFDMKDLLSDVNGNLVSGQTFFTAKQILTVNPLTINDYRKLLVDLAGVQNAWLIAEDVQMVNGKTVPVNEVPIYADCINDQLIYTPNEHPLFLSGLYRVLLSLDYDDQFGDLNDGDIVTGNPELVGKYVENEFYFSIELDAWKNADFDFAQLAKDKTKIQSAVLSAGKNGWTCALTVSGVPNPKVFGVTISKLPESGKLSEADAQSMFDNKDWVAGIFAQYLSKIKLAQTIVKSAIKTLHEHRNLCEDFVEVTTADTDQIAFCFDTDVRPDADIEKVQAEIFYLIENYLNPPVQFFSLKELLEKKVPVDEIFNGPVLQHGFIDTIQLESTNLKKEIYASDIINLLMDIEGVIAIRNFQMTKYKENGEPDNAFKNLKWCMPVKPFHKPVLRTDKSKILLFKNEFPFIARYDEVKDTVLLLHAIRSRNKLSGLQDDIPVPKGAKRDTESYWPVQYDFPLVYGIGEAGLAEGVTPERKAQQRQLKAYLLFYEQLLADFFSQLSFSHELFSTDKIKHTYYAQFLADIKNIETIYKPNVASAILNDAISDPDATKAEKNEWQKLYETKETFEDRRGRFFDHLLARFAESFNDYALMMYTINYEEQTEEKISFEELSTAKILTLQQYDDISANRGKAFNYFPQIVQVVGDDVQFLPDPTKYWDTDNVSGLEKRICALTGIKDHKRRFLYCIKQIEIICTEKEVLVEGNKVLKCFHSFTVTPLNGTQLISKEYEIKTDAEAALADVINGGAVKTNYSVITVGGKFKISYKDILTGVNEYNSQGDATTAINEIALEFEGTCNDPEGLHLIEHILLRPRTNQFDLMQVCLHDCDCPCEIDPYTFRASVVLPYWPGHFDNPAFRSYFENRLREEAPAHVMLKICWLNNDLMREFEVRYKRWIELLAAYSFDKIANEADFMDANNKMIEILERLHSEYPQATLHNCDESKEGSNTVVLNKTVLGTFKT